MASQRSMKVTRENAEKGRGGEVAESCEWRVESEKVCSMREERRAEEEMFDKEDGTQNRKKMRCGQESING